MLIGEHRHSIDSKGRIIIPSKFREELGEGFIITKGLDGCLFVYPKNEWEIIDKKLRELSIAKKTSRSFSRTFYSGASSQEVDKQGRALIPQNLRDYAGIEKEAVIIGLSSKVEIWAAEKWDEYSDDDGLSYEDMAEQMAELGI